MSNHRFIVRDRRRIRGFESILDRIYDQAQAEVGLNDQLQRPLNLDENSTNSSISQIYGVPRLSPRSDDQSSLSSLSTYFSDIASSDVTSSISYQPSDHSSLDNESLRINVQELAGQRDEIYGLALLTASLFQDGNLNEKIQRRIYELLLIFSRLQRPPLAYHQMRSIKNSLATISAYKFTYCLVHRCYLENDLTRCCAPSNFGSLTVFNMEDTLKHVLERNYQYFNSIANPSEIEILLTKWYSDIWAGSEQDPDVIKITLIVNIDEAQMMKSSKTSTIPIPFTVAELPRYQRISKNNVYNLGIYHGPKGFPMDQIWLKTCIEPMKALNIIKSNGDNSARYSYTDSPLLIDTLYGRKKVLVKIGAIVMDTVAKAKCLNIKSFMGYYGCPYCFIEGTRHVDESSNSAVFVYPYEPENYFPPKTQQFYESAALISTESASPHFGVKGNTLMSDFVSIPDDIPIDYMHAVLEGVFKFLMSLSPLKNPRIIRFLDTRVKDLLLPHDFSRKFRKISEITYWKASECRSFLFYLVPILKDIVDPDTFLLMLSLSIATRFLASPKTQDYIADAETMIGCFLSGFQEIHGVERMRFNLHLLLHLARQTRRMGSIIDFSAFTFENNIYRLKKSFHGTRGQLEQMTISYVLDKGMDKHKDELKRWQFHFDPTNKLNFSEISTNEKYLSFDGDFIVENSLRRQLSFNYELDTIHIHQRLKLNHNVYHSFNYKAKKKSNSYMISYSNNREIEEFGKIICFIIAKKLQGGAEDNLIWLTKFEHKKGQNILKNVKPSTNSLRPLLRLQKMQDVFHYLRETDRHTLIHSHQITGKIVLIPTMDRENHFWASKLDLPFDHD